MATETRFAPAAQAVKSRLSIWQMLGGVLLVGVIGFLLLYRLNAYPVPWYDEGSHLHVAKNLALNGIYADYSSEGIRYYGPAVGVGPTVMLPIAAVFKVAGVSIPLARAVIVAYAALALLTLYALGTRLVDRRLGLIAVMLLVLAPGIEFIMAARNVLGEVPGLFFVLAGFWLWLKPGKRSLLQLVGVGLLMGLAAITKNQYALVVLPSLLLAWIADLVWYRQRGWLYFVIPGVIAGLMFAGWTYFVLVALGGGEFSENLATLRTASSGAFFIFGMDEMEKAVRFLTDSGVYAALFIPAVLYGVILSLRRTEAGQQWGTLLIFVLVSTGLFVTSLAWPRYAFPATAVASLFVARLLYDLTGGLRFKLGSLLRAEPSPLAAAGSFAALGLIAIMVILPLYLHLSAVRGQGSTDAYTLADYLNQNVPHDAVIETWEQEMEVLTDHLYHYPPQIVLAYSVEETWRGGQPANELYDFREAADAEYVLIGPFALYTYIYPEEYLEDYELVHTQGAYELYQRSN
jgi:4-amino-4-deoxy-L-arabinose transferase-like glycosyltransferase